MENTLYYGDNLEILRKYINDESVDLIYLDPPFNSKANYNVLFKDESGESKAQIQAFTDFWHWDEESAKTYDYLVINPNVPAKVSNLISALHSFLGQNQMSAYLVMMTVRLIELHRVLKNTGSLYLHCDPTASHYIKIILDAVFGEENFINEIVWKKTNSPKPQSEGFGKQHDIIFFYSKSKSQNCFNKIYKEPEDDYLKSFMYDDNDGKGKYQSIALSNKTGIGGFAKMKVWEWHGVKARWIYSKETLDDWWNKGLIIKTKNGYRKKYYLSESKGQLVSDIWVDKEVAPLQGLAREKLGYPTQKPLSLLERIILASSKENDFILDPFCGCGTAIDAAEKLKRKWIGIDITHLAINLIKRRIRERYPNCKFEVVGEPKDVEGAKDLALKDRYQFEWWALSLIDARPANDKKKGADQGVDGIILLQNPNMKEPIKALVQVKSGHVKSDMITALKGAMERDKAKYGIFITLEEPTQPMVKEALEKGFETELLTKEKIPRVEIITIKELLEGKMPKLQQVYNRINISYQKAEKDKTKEEKGYYKKL